MCGLVTRPLTCRRARVWPVWEALSTAVEMDIEIRIHGQLSGTYLTFPSTCAYCVVRSLVYLLVGLCSLVQCRSLAVYSLAGSVPSTSLHILCRMSRYLFFSFFSHRAATASFLVVPFLVNIIEEGCTTTNTWREARM
ncbi:hypothetical protein LZ30DRAFT_705763 [Colletotrichum cereale]|nr:hypothetical protein LZ30DRAFT_705763 [Colletotrichum cereale]